MNAEYPLLFYVHVVNALKDPSLLAWWRTSSSNEHAVCGDPQNAMTNTTCIINDTAGWAGNPVPSNPHSAPSTKQPKEHVPSETMHGAPTEEEQMRPSA